MLYTLTYSDTETDTFEGNLEGVREYWAELNSTALGDHEIIVDVVTDDGSLVFEDETGQNVAEYLAQFIDTLSCPLRSIVNDVLRMTEN